ncbi:GerMN domain-containing protein [Faecalicatena contorta]|uniref:GerMN domain-containing protein n=1 Tax=Faecalicatena contorta TaxID=39482 RepID=UPI003216E61E
MKRRIAGLLTVCFCLLLLLSACSKRTAVKDDSSFIYCLNGDRTGLIKVNYEVKSNDPLQAAEAMLKELAKPSEDIDYTAPIPKGVKVNTCKLEGKLLYLDFNGRYTDIPPLEEKLVRAAVVQSLIRIEGISVLWISVDGEDLRDSEGQILGYQNEDDFVQNTGSSLNSYQTGTLTLYFANETGDKLTEQHMDVKYSSNMSKEKLIVEKLMKGPKKNAGYPTINPAVSLLGVTIKDGICYVNLDDEFLTGGVDVKPEITIYSIVNSLVEGTTASKVQITVNGEKNISYKDAVDLTQPLQRDMGWVENAEEE